MERRNGQPDIWLILLYLVCALGWVVLIGFQVLWWLAKPEMDTGLVRFHQIDIREGWISELAVWMPFLLALCTLTSIIALYLQRIRGRRQLDGIGWNIWLLLVLVCASGILFWLQYR